MNATIVVLRVDGHGVEHLSLHTKREQADDALGAVAEDAWRDRFGYELRDDLTGDALVEALRSEGYRVRVAEEPVEL